MWGRNTRKAMELQKIEIVKVRYGCCSLTIRRRGICKKRNHTTQSWGREKRPPRLKRERLNEFPVVNLNPEVAIKKRGKKWVNYYKQTLCYKNK